MKRSIPPKPAAGHRHLQDPGRQPGDRGELGLEGDFIANQKHHGGPDQAVYIYGQADYDFWAEALGQPVEPGLFGENLTISGLESGNFNIGDYLTDRRGPPASDLPTDPLQ